jgi:hypothetical protein
MFSLTESVTITASPGVIWTHLLDLERWWTASNPDHIRLEIASPDKRVETGTRVEFEERIAGVRRKATGRIVWVHVDSAARWEGTAAYRWMGMNIPMEEGVEWHIAGMGELAIVSARVWMYFPKGLFGRAVKWYAMKVLKIERASREHTRLELKYLKGMIEGN